MHLRAEQARSIEQRIAAIEERTGVQVLVALIGRCDAYPEIRWKAFALAVALASLVVVFGDFLLPGRDTTLVAAVVAILACGTTNALLAHYLPAYGRHFVRRNRAEAETRDYARALFLERALFATPSRMTVLILAGLFEHVVVVHPDQGFADRIDDDGWAGVVDAIVPKLASGDRQAAIESGLDALGELLGRTPLPETDATRNSLPDRPIEERGP